MLPTLCDTMIPSFRGYFMATIFVFHLWIRTQFLFLLFAASGGKQKTHQKKRMEFPNRKLAEVRREILNIEFKIRASFRWTICGALRAANMVIIQQFDLWWSIMAAVASHWAALLHRASPRRCGMSRRVAACVSSNHRMWCATGRNSRACSCTPACEFCILELGDVYSSRFILGKHRMRLCTWRNVWLCHRTPAG
jgi:hypothetical protein